jgi:hypothetical protein
VSDALAQWGVEFNATPVRPADIVRAVAARGSFVGEPS